MDAFDNVLTSLSEKQLLILNLRVQANLLNRLKRLESMADLVQKHLLPKDAEHYYKETGNACDALIEMLPFAANTNCGLVYNDAKLDEIVESAVHKIAEFKARFDDENS